MIFQIHLWDTLNTMQRKAKIQHVYFCELNSSPIEEPIFLQDSFCFIIPQTQSL